MSFEKLLEAVSREFKGCPKDEPDACKGCKNPVTRYLKSIPEIFAIGLVWESPNPTLEEIEEMLLLVQPTIDLNKVFGIHETEQATPMRLRGMICYYGKHYDVYFYSEHHRKWLVFDDATVKSVSTAHS